MGGIGEMCVFVCAPGEGLLDGMVRAGCEGGVLPADARGTHDGPACSAGGAPIRLAAYAPRRTCSSRLAGFTL